MWILYLTVYPEEIWLIYSINQNNKIEWVKIETHADNDENEFFVSTFNSRHLSKPNFDINLFEQDLDFIKKEYKNIKVSKFSELSESYNTTQKNWILIIGCLLLGLTLFLMHKLFDENSFK